MTVGERLLFYRKKKELSLGELSRMTGIPKTNLMRYEKGLTQKIPIDVIPMLEKALALESGTLMGWTDNNKDIEKVTSEFTLSNHEKQVVLAYRQQPSMQEAVDRLLGVSETEAKEKRA